MSEEKNAIVGNTPQVVGKKNVVNNAIYQDYLSLKNTYENKKNSLKQSETQALLETLLQFTDVVFKPFVGNNDCKYLEPIFNLNYPPYDSPGNYFFLDTAETITKNEIVDPRIMRIELQAVAFAPNDNPVCFFHASGRGPNYVKEKHKKPMKEMALAMNFTSEQMEKIKKRIIFGPEMNIFSLSMFSDEIIKNLPENHPAWKKENKEKMDRLFMDIDLLPQTPPNSSWVKCADADNNMAFWNFDETILQNWYRNNGLACPAILSAFASKCKIVMPTGEKVRIWDEKKQAWIVPFMPDHPRIQKDAKIISDYIKANKLDHIYSLEQVTTAFNNQILDENGQLFNKGTSAYKAAVLFSKVTGKSLSKIPNKAKSAFDSDSDSEMAEAINCSGCLVDARTKPGDRTKFHMVAKAKENVLNTDATYEFLRASLSWLNIEFKE